MDKTKIDIFNTSLIVPLLTILFIGLKLTNYITWSWLWVLSPIWISAILTLIIIFAIIILYILIK